MQELYFAFKMLLLSLVVVVLLQVKFGASTIEDYTLSLAKSSHILEPLDKVVEGAVLFSKDLFKRIKQ